MTQDQQIRQQLAKALDWGEAHPDFHTVIDNFPVDLRGEIPPGFTHSAWELLEHLRIALWDIVEFRWAPQVSAVAAGLLAPFAGAATTGGLGPVHWLHRRPAGRTARHPARPVAAAAGTHTTQPGPDHHARSPAGS